MAKEVVHFGPRETLDVPTVVNRLSVFGRRDEPEELEIVNGDTIRFDGLEWTIGENHYRGKIPTQAVATEDSLWVTYPKWGQRERGETPYTQFLYYFRLEPDWPAYCLWPTVDGLVLSPEGDPYYMTGAARGTTWFTQLNGTKKFKEDKETNDMFFPDRKRINQLDISPDQLRYGLSYKGRVHMIGKNTGVRSSRYLLAMDGTVLRHEMLTDEEVPRAPWKSETHALEYRDGRIWAKALPPRRAWRGPEFDAAVARGREWFASLSAEQQARLIPAIRKHRKDPRFTSGDETFSDIPEDTLADFLDYIRASPILLLVPYVPEWAVVLRGREWYFRLSPDEMIYADIYLRNRRRRPGEYSSAWQKQFAIFMQTVPQSIINDFDYYIDLMSYDDADNIIREAERRWKKAQIDSSEPGKGMAGSGKGPAPAAAGAGAGAASGKGPAPAAGAGPSKGMTRATRQPDEYWGKELLRVLDDEEKRVLTLYFRHKMGASAGLKRSTKEAAEALLRRKTPEEQQSIELYVAKKAEKEKKESGCTIS